MFSLTVLQFCCYLNVMQVYFSELKYTYIEAEAAYTELALLCDIGGALGLILGSTMLTFCEFTDLLVTLAAMWLRLRHRGPAA